MRILYLTHRLPYAPNRGDRVRAYHTLRVLSRVADVHVLSLVHDDHEARQTEPVRQFATGVTVVRVPRARNLIHAAGALTTTRPLTHVLLDAPGLNEAVTRAAAEHRPDAVLALCSGMARLAGHPSLQGLPFYLDMVDVDSRKWTDMAAHARGPKAWVYGREARYLGAFEGAAARSSRATFVVNEREAQEARRLAPGANVVVAPNGVDVEYFRPRNDIDRRPDVVFCGVMNYAPNEQGALWLAKEVWPLVRERRPDARLTVVGSNPTRRLVEACADDPSIEVTGAVPDVRPYLWRSSAAAAPLIVARGIQNKVLEAFAAGLPVVATPSVAEGLPRQLAAKCLVSPAPGEFAASLLTLLNGSMDGRAGLDAFDVRSQSWEQTLVPLVSAFELVRRASPLSPAPAIRFSQHEPHVARQELA